MPPRESSMRYAILESDGVTVAEFAPDEETAFMSRPKRGRMIQRDGIVLYVARDGSWNWAGMVGAS